MDEIRDLAEETIIKNLDKKKNNYTSIKNNVKDELSSFLYQKTKRKPMILPVVIEIPCNQENRA